MNVPKHLQTTWTLVGGLSEPSKLPGYAYSLPASVCITGSKLHKKTGSVCEKCYALKGRYNFNCVQQAMHRRLASITLPEWVPSMVALIKWAHAKGYDHFRWHDSGDIQSVDHLDKIKAVADGVPEVSFWLPTREAAIVSKSKYPTPSNLVIRESCHFIDAYYPSKNGNLTSTVHSSGGNIPPSPITYKCPAYTQGGKCGSCRACWDPTVQNVSYPKH